MTQPTCGAPTKAGTLCKVTMNLSASTGKCLMHDDERIAERARVRSAGGAASKVAKVKAKAADPANAPKAPRTLDDAVKIAAWITYAVLTGEIDVRVAEAATKAVRQFQIGEGQRTLQDQIKQLRSELAEARKETHKPALGIARG